MNLFLLYFGVLYYILYFMGLDFFALITLQYRTGGQRPASKLRSLFHVCTLHCVLQSLLIHNDNYACVIYYKMQHASPLFAAVLHMRNGPKFVLIPKHIFLYEIPKYI